MPSNNLSESFLKLDKPFRLLFAPGVTQLMTGFAAICRHDVKSKNALPIKVVVYGLHSENTLDFFEVIKEAANHLGIEEVYYIDEPQILFILNSNVFFWLKKRYINKALYRKILGGLLLAQELWLCSNVSTLSRILQASYPGRSFCYGDGPGVYITTFNKALFPTQPIINFKPSLRRVFSLKNRNVLLPNILKPKWHIDKIGEFRFGYLSFAEGLGELPSFPFESKGIDFRLVVLKLYSNFGITGFFKNFEISTRIKDAPKILLFLSSNHSEANRISLENEVEGYLQTIQTYVDHLVIIKPHPRDSTAKIDLLQKKLKEVKIDFLEIDGKKGKYLPIEILMEFLVDSASGPSNVKVVASSTVIYTFAKYYGLKSEIGFSSEFVRQYFFGDCVESRLVHDDVLRSYTSTLLKQHIVKSATSN